MACEICRRSACTRSFHSLDDQERFDSREESKKKMSDDFDELREEILDLKQEIIEAKQEFYNSGLETAISLVKDFDFEEQENIVYGLENSKI